MYMGLSQVNALVAPKILNGLEGYVVLSKPIVDISSKQTGHILLYNHGDIDKKIRAKIVYVFNNYSRVVYDRELLVKSRGKIVESIELSYSEKPGIHKLRLLIDEQVIDETHFYVVEKYSRDSIYFTIVWHNHQAPNYTPTGEIHSPWAFVYVWGAYLAPYGYGPYHYHAYLLGKKKELKFTYNLSPSLLAQWIKAIEEGIKFSSGEKYDSSSPEIGRIRETLDLYIDAYRRRQIDVLTSIYAHTIAGFLVDVLDAVDIVDEEIAYGKKITEKVFGAGIEGIWTPEMAFSMGLIPIYKANNIKYTVLDDQYHFSNALGDKDTPYEPYIVLNTVSGEYITVFFRDHELSDIIGFKNNFLSEVHAWRNAYETSLKITDRWFNNKVKTLVIALDGENWMVFSRNPPLTAYYLDKLSDLLISIDREGFIKLATLKEMSKYNPPKNVLKYIPTNTWLGSFRKWFGEVKEQENYWVEAAKRYRILRAYEKMVGGRDKQSLKARYALWHALDSDYWWAEFWSPNIISMWLKEFDEIMNKLINSIKIKEIKLLDEPIEGSSARLSITIENMLEKNIRASVKIGGLGIIVNKGEDIKPVLIKPKSLYERIVNIRFLQWGRVLISVAVVIDGYLLDTRYYIVDTKPFLRKPA